MPFNRPSLPEIRDRIRADIRSRLPDARPEQRRSLLGILADVDAGGLHGVYGFLDYLSREVTPYTAEDTLTDWARVWGLSQQSAQAATGSITVTGDEGVTVPEGRELEGSSGALYTTTGSATITSGNAEVPVEANEAGTEGNLAAGETLRFVSALAGVDGEATVAGDGLTGGADAETRSRLRERLLERIQEPPHGGAAADYRRWARDAHPDVTREWVSPNEVQEGTVTVRIMTDGATADGIPEASVVTAVQDYIDERCPVHLSDGAIFVVAPDAVPLAMEIDLTPDTEEVRSRVQSAVQDYIERESKPGGTIYREELSGVIYVAAGDSRHRLVSPTADVTHSLNEIAVPGAITWSA